MSTAIKFIIHDTVLSIPLEFEWIHMHVDLMIAILTFHKTPPIFFRQPLIRMIRGIVINFLGLTQCDTFLTSCDRVWSVLMPDLE